MQIALICVLVAALLPYVWTSVAKARGPRYDNSKVRDWQSSLTGMPLRAHAAHLNSFEAFPMFAAAVLAAIATGVDPGMLATLSVAFVGLRIIYGIVYLMDLATLRSLVWFGALGCSAALLVLAIRAAGGS